MKWNRSHCLLVWIRVALSSSHFRSESDCIMLSPHCLAVLVTQAWVGTWMWRSPLGDPPSGGVVGSDNPCCPLREHSRQLPLFTYVLMPLLHLTVVFSTRGWGGGRVLPGYNLIVPSVAILEDKSEKCYLPIFFSISLCVSAHGLWWGMFTNERLPPPVLPRISQSQLCWLWSPNSHGKHKL